MTEYQCTRCSYIYEPGEGDPTADVPPHTPWTKLPDEWACPHCGIDKEQFEQRKEVE